MAQCELLFLLRPIRWALCVLFEVVLVEWWNMRIELLILCLIIFKSCSYNWKLPKYGIFQQLVSVHAFTYSAGNNSTQEPVTFCTHAHLRLGRNARNSHTRQRQLRISCNKSNIAPRHRGIVAFRATKVLNRQAAAKWQRTCVRLRLLLARHTAPLFTPRSSTLYVATICLSQCEPFVHKTASVWVGMTNWAWSDAFVNYIR